MIKYIPSVIFIAVIIISIGYLLIGSFIKISGQESTKLSVEFRPKLSFFLAILTSAFLFVCLCSVLIFNPIQKIVCEHSLQ